MTESTVKRARSPKRAAGPRPATHGDRIQSLALVATAWLLGLLGVDRASSVMGRAWRLFAPLNPRHARADAHLAAAMPDLGPGERRAILGDMWENLGRTAAEAVLLPSLIEDRGRFTLAVDDEIARIADAGTGAIFASLHLGNWELAGWGIRLAGFSTAAVYQPLKNPLAERFLRAKREPIYDAGLHPRETSTAFRLRSLARRGVAVGMLADLRDATGIEVRFFGRRAFANALPAVFARRLGLPLIAGQVVRTGGANFRIEARRIDIPTTADLGADIAAATRSLSDTFEEWIRRNPGQWMWAHRKWVDDG